MIVVFTGGDELEDGETLDDYLARDCHKYLKEILTICGNRHVLFNNKTKDEAKKSEQWKQLLTLVNAVVDKNGGKPYLNQQFVELKGATNEFFYDAPTKINSSKEYFEEEIFKVEEQLQKSYEEQLKRIADTVEAKLKESFDKLGQQLEGQEIAQMKSNAEIHKLILDLENENLTRQNYQRERSQMETLIMCENRRVLFNSKGKEKAEKFEQLKQPQALVDEISDKNGGNPYSKELFVELKKSRMAVTFSDLHTESGLKALDGFLSGKSYIFSDRLTKDDVKVYGAILDDPSSDLYPNASKWYKTVSSKLASTFPGKSVGVSVGGQVAAAEEEKKSAKKKGSGKSSRLLDVKPWDDETDMKKLEEVVRGVEMEGISWGASKLIPVGYGIKKLQIILTIVDDLVSVDSVIEELLTVEAINEYVQSCDVVACNII